MKKILIPLGIALSTALISCSAARDQFDTASTTENRQTYHVSRDKDGDTFEFEVPNNPFPNLPWSVRVNGIDTPEKGYLAKCSREKERAAKASAFTANLLEKSKWQVELRNVEWDKYGGRIDSDVYLSDGSSLAQRLIDAGLAKPYNGNGPKPNWCY